MKKLLGGVVVFALALVLQGSLGAERASCDSGECAKCETTWNSCLAGIGDFCWNVCVSGCSDEACLLSCLRNCPIAETLKCNAAYKACAAKVCP